MPAVDPGYNQPKRKPKLKRVRKDQRVGGVGRGADTTPTPSGPPAPSPKPPVAPKNPAPAFRPVRSQAAPFKAQTGRAKAKTRRAESKLPTSRTPYRPKGRNVPVFTPRPFTIDQTQTSRSPAFRPIGSQVGGPTGAAPMRVEQSRVRQAARQARNQLPDHPDIPKVVGGLYLQTDLDALDSAYKRARLKAAKGDTKGAQADYEKAVRDLEARTPEEKISRIREAYKSASRKLGGTSISELYQYGSLRQRRQMRQVGRLVSDFENAQAANVAAQRGQLPQSEEAQAIQKPSTADMNPAQAALLPLDKLTHPIGRFLDERTRIPGKANASLFDLANVPVQLGRATLEDPEAVGRSSLRTAVESLAGIPEGVKVLLTDPKKGLAGMAADYERRYGAIFDDPAEFRKRVKEESGLTPFVMDAASLGVPIGRAATILARSGPAGRAVAALARVADEHGTLRPLSDFAGTAHKAARAPRDAKRLNNLFSELKLAEREGDTARQATLRSEIPHAQANVRATERPALRFSGGEGGVRKQPASKNLFVGLGQRALDRSRATAATRDASRAGLDQSHGVRLLTVRGRQVKRMTALRPGEREVVPKTTGIVGRSMRELPGMRRYTGRVARDLGGEQSVTRIKLLTHRGRVLNKVNKALGKLDDPEQESLKYMLQLGATPDHAGIRILEDRRAQIMDARDRAGTRIAPLLENTNDELQLINRILDNPAEHLTPRARAVADELRDIQIEEARRDPELTSDQEAIRRMTPQGRALGVTRGPDVGFFQGVLQDLEHGLVDEHGQRIAPGLAAHADELAAMMPDARGRRASEMRREITQQRKRSERDVETAKGRLGRMDEKIRTLEKRGVPIETVEVRDARAALSRAKRARRAVGRRIPGAQGRHGRVAGRVGERERRGQPLATPEVRAARDAVSAADRHVNSLERQLQRAEEHASRAQGVTEGRFAAGKMTEGAGRAAAERADTVAELQAALKNAKTAAATAREHLKRTERDAPRITPGEFKTREAAAGVPEALRRELEAADQTVADARAALKGELGKAPRVTERIHEVRLMRERELAASRATREHVRKFEKAMRQVVRASKDKRTMRLEDAETFSAKVARAAEDYGLASPAYWWSSMMPGDMPSLAAAGRGLRAAHGNKRYKGTLFDIGAEEHSPDVFTRGIERNIKRRFQQALVARNLETHAYEWSRGPNGKGRTIAQLEAEMRDRAIDPNSIELVEPRVMKRRGTEAQGVERGQVLREEDVANMTEEDFISTTQQDLASGRRRWEEVTNGTLMRDSKQRYLAVPREVGETLDGLTSKMDNKFWRGMEVVLKQKPARILLGAANVPWLSFQIASNALLTGFGGSVNPWNVVGAHKWWKALSPDEREAVEAELGITHGHHFGMDEVNLGASNSRYVNFWRAYKKSRAGRIGHRINPLNVMFRADEAQNNFFRRTLFYDKSRKMAYRRMGHSWKGIDRAMTRAVDRVLARPPMEQANLIARHGEDFEAVAKHVNDFLGDYMRFTPAERFLLQRNIMFYGYLRFSLRFTFYTMPVAHPVMANIMGNIGRMGADEIKKLMGVPDGYQLPSSMLTQVYFGDRKDAKKGDLRSLPLGRFNPFLNALTQLDGLQQAVGLVSPFYQALADQAFEESSFTGRDWRIGGRPTPSESDRPRNYFGSAANLLNPLAYDLPGHEGRPRNRIFEASLLNLAFPARVVKDTGIPGLLKPLEPNQSDDALPWRPEPMQYADPGAQKGVDKSRKAASDRSAGRKAAEALFPIFPKRTATPAVVARELEREDAIRKRNSRKPGARKKRRRKKKTTTNYSGGSTGGGRYGG